MKTRLVKNDVSFTKYLQARLRTAVDNAFAVTSISEDTPIVFAYPYAYWNVRS